MATSSPPCRVEVHPRGSERDYAWFRRIPRKLIVSPQFPTPSRDAVIMSPLRTAVVTGASAGIGREIVRQLVRDRGMAVLATARRLDRLEDLAAELPAGSVHVLGGALADPAFRARLWEHAERV